MPDLPDPVRGLLYAQDGVVTRAQLLDNGVSRHAVQWHAGRTWRIVLPQTYVLGRSEPTVRQRLVAALLWAGPRSVLAGATAARIHGLGSANPGQQVQLVVPAPQRSRSNTFATVRRTVLEDAQASTRGVLRLSSPARACVDAALGVRLPRDREALLIEAVQRGIASLNDLAEWSHRLRPRDAVIVRQAVDAAATGAWSLPEAELLDLIGQSGILPQPWANPELRGAAGRRLLTPDLWFDDVAMAVMVHSHAYHSQGEQWDGTVEGDGDLVAAGVVVAAVTPRRLRTQPADVLRRIERTYDVAVARPRPAVVASARPLWSPARVHSRHTTPEGR